MHSNLSFYSLILFCPAINCNGSSHVPQVMVNGQEYKPSVAASTKKLAKANAAAACLQSLGLFPKDPANPL